jgi:succinate dehydrogenase / fumarate reductase cytochrome b subunit
MSTARFFPAGLNRQPEIASDSDAAQTFGIQRQGGQMSWITSILGSSIGKKFLMSVTGLCFCLFLVGHLAGNLSIYAGSDAFNSYAAHLHALGPLVRLAEIGLLVLALIHVLTGLTLVYGNFKARPVRYRVNRNAGGRSLGSATMPYSGVLLLAFVIYHLANFHFVDKTHTTIFAVVSAAFSSPITLAIYVAAMIIAALHVSHGFWSAFQTIGANHPKYMPSLRLLSVGLALAFGIGFGFIPIFVSFVL